MNFQQPIPSVVKKRRGERAGSVAVRRLTLSVGCLTAAACAVETENYVADTDRGSTHAVITVERSHNPSEQPVDKASAFAGFARVPSDMDPADVMPLVGLGETIPPVGDCSLTPANMQASAILTQTPTGSGSKVEFLSAGNVSLQTPGALTILAPRAFPTVTNFISGVVYTTRDQAATPLPAGQPYKISLSGTRTLPPIEATTRAPQALSDLFVDNTALEEVILLPRGRDLDIAWHAGGSADIFYVSILQVTDAGPGDSRPFTCAFADSAGSGTLPFGGIEQAISPDAKLAALTFNRVRVAAFSAPSLQEGEVRFHFQQTVQVAVDE